MNRIHIVTHPDGTHDFQVIDAGNNKILAFSNQGYEHVEDAMDTARSVTTDHIDPTYTFSKDTP